MAVIRVRQGVDPSRVIQALLDLPDLTVRDLSVSRREKGTTIEADIVGPVGVDLSVVLAPIGSRDEVVDVDVP
jgi:hypothetical protein